VEEMVVRLFAMRESSWCATLVVMISLLRHISRRDRVPPSGVVGMALASTEVDLVSIRPIFRG